MLYPPCIHHPQSMGSRSLQIPAFYFWNHLANFPILPLAAEQEEFKSATFQMAPVVHKPRTADNRYDILQPLPGGYYRVITKAHCAVLWYWSKKSLKWKSVTPLHSNCAGRTHDICANPEFLFVIQTRWLTSVSQSMQISHVQQLALINILITAERKVSSDFPAPYQHVSQAQHYITWQRFTWSLVLCAGYSRLLWETMPTAGLLYLLNTPPGI